MGSLIRAAEAAAKRGMTLRRMQALCRQRRIKGARLVGRVWMIPEDFEITPGTRGPALTKRSK
jgi:hypothetical protein